MSLDSLSTWLVSFLKQRGLNPDGRLLFSYDLSQDEYEALRHELSGTISAAGGLESLALHSLGRSRLMAPPAAFVGSMTKRVEVDSSGLLWRAQSGRLLN